MELFGGKETWIIKKKSLLNNVTIGKLNDIRDNKLKGEKTNIVFFLVCLFSNISPCFSWTVVRLKGCVQELEY